MCSEHNDTLRTPFPSSFEIAHHGRLVPNINLEILPESTFSGLLDKSDRSLV